MKPYVLVLILLFAFASFLRIYKIDTTPQGLYVDEASVAYNAYTILTTGNDEHGVSFPFAFQAFGEYKMPVFIYMTSVSMALFGKNEFAIRIPSAFFGSLTVILFYFFVKEVLIYEKKLDKKQKEICAFLCTLLLAISPWHIQFSRAGFEAIVAFFFFLSGLLFFLLYYRKKKTFFLFFSFAILVWSMYTYNAFRVIAPITVISLSLFLYFSFPKKRMTTLGMGVLAFALASPMLAFSFTHAGQARFSQVTAFTGSGIGGLLAYPLQYLNNYLAHFSLSFLFSYGDTIGRHTVLRMGAFYKWEIIFLLLGIYFLVREKFSFFSFMIVFLLFVSPVAAALALPSPHLLRSLPLVLPITLIIGYGLTRTFMVQKKKYILLAVILIVALFEFTLYLDYYYSHAAVTLADWGGQYKELLNTLAQEKQQDTVIILNMNVGMNPVYEKFYHPEMSSTMVSDTWQKPTSLSGKNILYVTSAEAKVKNTYLHTFPHTLIHTITTPDSHHTPLYNIWKI